MQMLQVQGYSSILIPEKSSNFPIMPDFLSNQESLHFAVNFPEWKRLKILILVFFLIAIGNLHPFSIGSCICKICHNPLFGPFLLRLWSAVITYHLVEKQKNINLLFQFISRSKFEFSKQVAYFLVLQNGRNDYYFMLFEFAYKGNIYSKENRNIDRKTFEICRKRSIIIRKSVYFHFRKWF